MIKAVLPRSPSTNRCEILIDDDSGASAFSQGYRVFSVSDPDTTTVLQQPDARDRDSRWPRPLHTDRTPFVLDGRFLHAFNGPGLGPMAVYGNFRVNGGLLAGDPQILAVGNPDGVGMDEDYDACDLENWFLAIQSADGQVVVPSFHRPGIIRADPERCELSQQPSRSDDAERLEEHVCRFGGSLPPSSIGRRP